MNRSCVLPRSRRVFVSTCVLACAVGRDPVTAAAASPNSAAPGASPSTATAAPNAAAPAALNPTDTRPAGPPVVVWPTLTPAGDAPAPVSLHRPQPGIEKDVYDRSLELDATLRDAVQDLGFALNVADTGPSPGRTRDEDLLARAAASDAPGASASGTWVVSPRIEAAGSGAFTVRIVAVAPTGRELRVRVETVPPDSVGVRGLVMLRALLSSATAAQATVEQERDQVTRGTAQGVMSPLRSQGRAVLAINTGLFGGFAAFSAQRASGSTDPRVLYPLLALGTGVGVGAALLAADEWDVTSGDAWVLSAGALWGAASAYLLAAGRDLQPFNDRYSWGVGGGLIGATLATAAVTLTRTPMDDGDAAMVQSGGTLGLLFGAGAELFVRGSLTQVTPFSGMGYGAALGLLAAGATATQVTMAPSRVLLVDVGAGSGALIGAAVASPLIFEEVNPGKTRGWLAATLGGGLVGGAAAAWFTRDASVTLKKHAASSWLHAIPFAGIVAASETRGGPVPAFGLVWKGPL